jgi:hypothetical protein
MEKIVIDQSNGKNQACPHTGHLCRNLYFRMNCSVNTWARGGEKEKRKQIGHTREADRHAEIFR